MSDRRPLRCGVALRLAGARAGARRSARPSPRPRRSSRPTWPWSRSSAPPRVDVSPDVVWIMAVGSDARPGEDMTRTRGDALQLIGLNTKTGAAAAIGIPRDSYVSIPGVGSDRINAALYYGGPQLLGETVGDLIGIEPDYVFVTRFEKFKSDGQRHRRHRRRQPDLLQRHLPQAHRASSPGTDPPQRLPRPGVLPDPHDLLRGDFDRSANQQRVLQRHPGQDPRARRPRRLHRVRRALGDGEHGHQRLAVRALPAGPGRGRDQALARSPPASSWAGSATSAAPAWCCPTPTRPSGSATGPARTPRWSAATDADAASRCSGAAIVVASAADCTSRADEP